jgi:hypothetical protein
MLLGFDSSSAERRPALGHLGSGVATVLFEAFSFKEKAGKEKYLLLLAFGNRLKAIVLRPEKHSILPTLKPEEPINR